MLSYSIERKIQLKEAFEKCKEQCCCPEKCAVAGMRQCSNCKDVLKSQCAKVACTVNGEKPQMLLPASTSVVYRKSKKSSRKLFYCEDSTEEESSDSEDEEDDYEEPQEEPCIESDLEQVWKSLSPPV